MDAQTKERVISGLGDLHLRVMLSKMENRYKDQEARRYIDQYGDVPADLAIRVYTSRLIGAETDLVLHGGGNTSVKTTITNILG